MIEGTEIVARKVEPVNVARIHVRYVKLIVSRIEGDIAKARAAIGQATRCNIGKTGDFTRRSVYAPDCSRSTTKG